jgi:hypothetical protein
MAFNQGYSVAAKHGRFYTNLEDKDRTVAVDLKTHEIVATWNPACGGGGPHGLGWTWSQATWLGHARANEVAHRGPAEIVRDPPRATSVDVLNSLRKESRRIRRGPAR